MSKRPTKALYRAGDFVVKSSEAKHRNAPVYVVTMNQQPHEQYISLSRDNLDYMLREDFIEPYGAREQCSTK